MTKTCNNNGKLLEEILKREDMSQLTASEKAHIDNCPQCKAELNKIINIENRLKTYAATSLAAIPMRKFKLPASKMPQTQPSLLEKIISALKTWQFATAVAVIITCSFLILTGIRSANRRTSGQKIKNITLGSAHKSELQHQPTTIKTSADFLVVESLQKFTFEGYSIEADNAVIRLDNQSAQLKHGHILCKVTTGTELTIITPTAEVKVLGTEFEVTVYDNDETYVNVITGRVKVTQSNNRETLILAAGQNTTVLSPPATLPQPDLYIRDQHMEDFQNDADDGFAKPEAKTLNELLK